MVRVLNIQAEKSGPSLLQPWQELGVMPVLSCADYSSVLASPSLAKP